MRGLKRNQLYWHLDLGIPASDIVEKFISVVSEGKKTKHHTKAFSERALQGSQQISLHEKGRGALSEIQAYGDFKPPESNVLLSPGCPLFDILVFIKKQEFLAFGKRDVCLTPCLGLFLVYL